MATTAAEFSFQQSGWITGGQRNNPNNQPEELDVVLSGSFSGIFNSEGQIQANDLTAFSINWPGNSFVPAFSATELPEGSLFCYGLGCTAEPGLQFRFENPLPSLNVTQVALTSGIEPVGTLNRGAVGELSSLIRLAYVNTDTPVIVEPLNSPLINEPTISSPGNEPNSIPSKTEPLGSSTPAPFSETFAVQDPLQAEPGTYSPPVTIPEGGTVLMLLALALAGTALRSRSL